MINWKTVAKRYFRLEQLRRREEQDVKASDQATPKKYKARYKEVCRQLDYVYRSQSQGFTPVTQRSPIFGMRAKR